jgi:hypothetical protein
LLRFVLSQVIFSRCVLCCEPSSVLVVFDGRRGLVGGGGGFVRSGGGRVQPAVVAAGPPCSACLDALSSSPFCAAVRTPPPSVAVFCVVPRSPSSPPLVRPQVSLLLFLPPRLSHLRPPNGGGRRFARRVGGDASASRSSGAAVGASSEAMRWSEVVCACAWRCAEATAASRAVMTAGVRHCRAACTGVGMAGIGLGLDLSGHARQV